MKKKIILSISSVILLIGFIFCLISIKKNNPYMITKDGVMFALSMNGSPIQEFPLSGDYKVDIDCKNAKGTWLSDEWRLSLKDITGKVTCNISFNTVEDSDKLINIITDLKDKTTINSGICSNEMYKTKTECESNNEIWWGVFDENGLRFEGLNPDNYILFNNELWRIIGYLPTKDKNNLSTNLVKIIREETIGSLVINTTANSTFVNSNLDNILNNYYYLKKDGTKSGHCYSYSSTAQGNCDYREIGLDEYSRKKIMPVQWAIGTYKSSNTPANHYTNEIKTYTDVTNGINIGLMSVSDFGYGALASDCARTKTLAADSYNTAKCAGTNWLFGKGVDWTISPYTTANASFISNGHISNSAANVGLVIRPVVYLDPSILVIDGSGKANDPYIIKLSELTVVKTSNASESLTVKATYNGTDEISKYYYSIDDGDYVSSPNNTYTFTGLKENTTYKVKVYTVNSEGVKGQEKTNYFKTRVIVKDIH